MDRALQALIALPNWFFSSVLRPFEAGWLTLIPAIGTLLCLAGVVAAMRSQNRQLIFFFVPFGLSELFVALAGFGYGTYADRDALTPVMIGFGVLAVAATILATLRNLKTPVTAGLLFGFSLTYALTALVFALGAFTAAPATAG